MSIFEAEERRLMEAEREESEIIASNERQKEVDESLEKIKHIDALISDCDKTASEDDERNYINIIKEGLILVKQKCEVIINGDKLSVSLPYNFNLGDTVYMIPTNANGLDKIYSYKILRFGVSSIGPRADLFIEHKAPNIESAFCASFDMFNTSIFKTLNEAEAHYKLNAEA